MTNNCCGCSIEGLAQILKKTLASSNQIQELIEEVINNIPDNETSLYTIRQMLAHNNPMTIAAEYPDVQADRFVVSAPYTRFLDLLNTDMYVIFKIDNNNYNLPVYFKDSIGYEHRVVLPDGTPVLANQLQLNGIYSAKYQYTGGYIILNSLTPLNPDVISSQI